MCVCVCVCVCARSQAHIINGLAANMYKVLGDLISPY